MLLSSIVCFLATTTPLNSTLEQEETPLKKLKFEPQEELVMNEEIEEIVFDDAVDEEVDLDDED